MCPGGQREKPGGGGGGGGKTEQDLFAAWRYEAKAEKPAWVTERRWCLGEK